ncbi:MAG: YitT family protein [Treponema sp.]|uniref:YitT family protein n=1 Tax=Treponema sp. TaxID=166 RepID=UPI0025FF3B76|nr:YitT family protein [Treponema sp.]MBQ8678151.1 YitT family protein [Treponema sp.]
MKLFFRFLTVTAGAVLMAVNLNTFVHTAELLPGGFTGITLLLQEIFLKYAVVKIPFVVFYWGLNIIPAAICFKYVGKRFTLLSIWAIIASGFLTDVLPGLSVTNDILLCTVFGGIVNGAAISLCLLAGATSGGTDFISIYVSEKTGRSIWNHIFIMNVVVLGIFGFLFGWSHALYSIIFQFASTQILNTLYKRYQKSTLLIITEKPDELVKTIRETTGHDATLFKGEGCYTGAERNMLYTVISSDAEEKLIRQIKKTDSMAFVNILQTKMLKGNFIMKKQD